MKRTKSETTEKGIRGVGNLVRLSATKARMDFEGGESKPIEVSELTLPDVLLKVFNKMQDNAKVAIEATLDKEETKILFCKPLMGTFDFKFTKFYTQGDTPPVITTKVGKGGKPYGLFTAVLEAQNKTGAKSDLWKGIRFNVLFFDNFSKDENGNLTVASRGENSDFLSDFMDVIGCGGDGVFKYSENPLPEIEKVALAEGKIFSADVRKVVSKGEPYANVVMFNVYDLSDGLEEVEDTGVHPALQ